MFTKVYGFLLRRVTFYNSTRFIGIIGGIQDFGAELRDYGEVLWRPTATGEVALLSAILQGGGSGIYARFCCSTTQRFTQFDGDLIRGFINVEES